MTTRRRELLLTPELLRAYSRRGNFHSDEDEATKLGLSGLVAQGMQVVGPAYGVLLDEWGEEFLEHGEVELKFVGMVMDGETVDGTVTIDGDRAEIRKDPRGAAVVGADQPEEHVLGPDVIVTELERFPQGVLERLLGPGAEREGADAR